MNVVYASDDNFAEIMGVSICSLFENNKDVADISVYVLDDNISETNRQKLDDLAKTYRRNIIYVSIEKVKSNLATLSQQRGSLCTFSRLMLSQLLPLELDRVLYLDCDTIIRKNINHFYNQDFDGNIVYGVLDCISKQHRARIGLKEDAIYINAGMMLVDFQAWQHNAIDEKIKQVIKKYSGTVPYADQGIVNISLQGKIKLVHPRYNCMSIFTAFSFNDLLEYRQPSACDSSETIDEAKKDPSIVHFVTLFCASRPWFKKSTGPYFNEWKLYKQKSPWKNAPERKQRKFFFQRLGAALYCFAPKSVSLTILGFLHARIKPWLMGK
jgi:lipopolysaccharide biosynthesis glycosyltransferase